MNRHLPVPPRTEYYTQRLHDLSNVLSVHSTCKYYEIILIFFLFMKDTNENINEIDRELSRTRVIIYYCH